MPERITITVVFTADDGTLADLENEGGDVGLVEAALERVKEGDHSYVDSSCEEFEI